MEVNSEHLGDGGVVGHDGLEVNVHTEPVAAAVDGHVQVHAVAGVESVGDLLAVAESQLKVSGAEIFCKGSFQIFMSCR